MRVLKVRVGLLGDSSGGMGYSLTLPMYYVISGAIASACVYFAVKMSEKKEKEEKDEAENQS